MGCTLTIGRIMATFKALAPITAWILLIRWCAEILSSIIFAFSARNTESPDIETNIDLLVAVITIVAAVVVTRSRQKMEQSVVGHFKAN